MTAIEHRELKGITLKNLIVTVMSTASIVASVMTTYFGLKSDIQEIRNTQQTESRINNIRLNVLENRISLLQIELDKIRLNGSEVPVSPTNKPAKRSAAPLLSAAEKK